MLTHFKQIIPRKPVTNQHSEIRKATRHNIKHIDRTHTTDTTEIHNIQYIHITKQNNIIYGDTFSSVSISKSLIIYKQQSKFKPGDNSSTLSKSTESDRFLDIQKKRNHNKQSNTSFDGTFSNINFNDNSILSGTNLPFPTETITKKS